MALCFPVVQCQVVAMTPQTTIEPKVSAAGTQRVAPAPPPAQTRSLIQKLWRNTSVIAIAVLLLLVAHLLLRFVLRVGEGQALVPLYAALLLGGLPIILELAYKLLHGDFGADLIAGISIVSAVLLHEYLVATIVVLMFSGGQALEKYATDRAASVLRALARRMPVEAHRVEGTGFVSVPVKDIVPGDVLLIFPHEICPVDGEVIEGHGRMDESFLTGEPFEISKAPGARVISGAVNGEAALKIRALKVAVESRYARILKVIHQSEENRPRIRRIGDRLGAWYTPFALGLATIGWLIGGTPERFLAVMVIATPCPLLLAIPIAILGGISLAARRGIVVRDPRVLEQIDGCRAFIFDKTGTLTYGRPVLTNIFCAPGYSEDEVLGLAASLEQYSRHPLAKGVLDAARKRQIAIPVAANVIEKPGEGLRGTVDTHKVHLTGRKQSKDFYGSSQPSLPPVSTGLECLIFVDLEFAAALQFQDEPRTESSTFIRHLRPKHHAQRVVLLSGDKESEVRYLAGQVGIREIYAGRSPEEKLKFVQHETSQGKTLFVGDGINDAPSMLAATVGVAMGGTSDVIAESADAVVLDSSVRKVDELIHIGRRMKTISLQSAIGGILLSGVGMFAAALGHLSPINGAIAQEVIDLIAVLNALRVTVIPRRLADF